MLTLQKLSPENCFILDIVPQSSSRTVFVDSTWVETQLLNTGGAERVRFRVHAEICFQ
jgi:hypothetical protein